jgi:hypothetical protein
MADSVAPAHWEQHDHEALIHAHEHPHVTHNFNDRTAGFDHLSSAHEHEHDHAKVSHSHFAHRDFESEHRGEAHDHDHGEAVKIRSPKKTSTGTKRSGTTRRASLKDVSAT